MSVELRENYAPKDLSTLLLLEKSSWGNTSPKAPFEAWWALSLNDYIEQAEFDTLSPETQANLLSFLENVTNQETWKVEKSQIIQWSAHSLNGDPVGNLRVQFSDFLANWETKRKLWGDTQLLKVEECIHSFLNSVPEEYEWAVMNIAIEITYVNSHKWSASTDKLFRNASDQLIVSDEHKILKEFAVKFTEKTWLWLVYENDFWAPEDLHDANNHWAKWWAWWFSILWPTFVKVECLFYDGTETWYGKTTMYMNRETTSAQTTKDAPVILNWNEEIATSLEKTWAEVSALYLRIINNSDFANDEFSSFFHPMSFNDWNTYHYILHQNLQASILSDIQSLISLLGGAENHAVNDQLSLAESLLSYLQLALKWKRPEQNELAKDVTELEASNNVPWLHADDLRIAYAVLQSIITEGLPLLRETESVD